ncbi:hypothetical protein SCLCIDRAFT_1213613 [Scleroderma citrinum Foug A]|uniref:Uncharacterized protein n=1 Tax=Scleroderma citrinum Foug A TaxID=1036808 RepID=A0A0C3E875_9AGAM|nr:hypothetical protein SCLCIDRAFT_1213613 [Scleroderma citrinum Foug A]
MHGTVISGMQLSSGLEICDCLPATKRATAMCSHVSPVEKNCSDKIFPERCSGIAKRIGGETPGVHCFLLLVAMPLL